MIINRFDEIAAELERLAAEIAAINAQPFEFAVEIGRENSAAKNERRGMNTLGDNVASLNAIHKRNVGPIA
jgi:hypothetical protein